MKKLITSLLVLLAAFSPLLSKAQTTESYTFTTNRLLPDGNLSGLNDIRTLASGIGNISSLKVRLKVTGEFNGDLYAYLRHTNGFVILLNRVGKTASSLYGYGDSGFNVSFQNGAANGDIHDYENILTPAAGSPLTGIWEPDGRSVDPMSVVDLSTRSTSLTNFNGINAAGDWTLYLADTESGGTNMLTEWGLDISGVETPSLVWAAPANITYGAALTSTQLNAGVTYNSTNVPGTYTYSPAAGTVLNAGNNQTISVTFTPTDTTSFATLTTNVTINVLQAPLTIAANSASQAYGSSLPGLTANYSGFVNGDSASSLTPQPTVATTATSGSSAGVYPITASGASSSNYAITYTSGSLTITQAALVITAQNLGKIYGAALPTLTASFTGFVNGDDATSLSTAPTLVTTATSASGVGTYPITVSGAMNANYAITYASGVFTVSPATISVTANNQGKAFGAAMPTFTATYSGFVMSQVPNNLSTLATLSTTATASSASGTYPITASGAASANYNFTYVNGTLTIGQSASSGAIVSSANPALPGTNVTFTMTLAAVAPGTGTPTGLVNFRVDGNIIASNTLSSGVATFTTASLTLGSHTVSAEYAGDANFTGATNALAQNQVIDTPPVAGAVTMIRNPLAGTKIRVASLMANASDADGDALNLTVSPTSANNATITMSGGWVFYTPAAGFTNADSFTYTVTDSRGGSATATVTIAIESDNNQSQNLTIISLGNGSYQINGNGIPGYTYRLQYSDTVAPFNWQNLTGASVTADNTGVFIYTDSTSSPTRFYRSVYP